MRSAVAGTYSDQIAEELGDRLRSIFADEDRDEVERALRRGFGVGMDPDVWTIFAKRLYVTTTAIERQMTEYRKRANGRNDGR